MTVHRIALGEEFVTLRTLELPTRVDYCVVSFSSVSVSGTLLEDRLNITPEI